MSNVLDHSQSRLASVTQLNPPEWGIAFLVDGNEIARTESGYVFGSPTVTESADVLIRVLQHEYVKNAQFEYVRSTDPHALGLRGLIEAARSARMQLDIRGDYVNKAKFRSLSDRMQHLTRVHERYILSRIA